MGVRKAYTAEQTVAPVIPLFNAAAIEAKVADYATVAAKLVATARKQGMDPQVLAAAMVAVVATEEMAAAGLTIDDVIDNAPADQDIFVGGEHYGPEGVLFDHELRRREVRGAKYVERRDVADVAKDVRHDIRQARRAGELVLPGEATVSVRISRYSMGRSITIHVTGLTPEQLWVTPGTGDTHGYPYNGGWADYRKTASRTLYSILTSYNRDNSDTLTDYYDVAFSPDVTFEEQP